MIDRGKRSKTLNQENTQSRTASWTHKSESAEFSGDKSCAKGSPSFTTRPFIWVVESFWIKGR